MTISAARTITLALPPSAGRGYGALIVPPPQSWPSKRVGDFLDYSLDLSLWLADVSDSILSITASASPAAAGDLVLTEIDVAGSLVTVWAGGGRPGILYAVELDIQTAAGRHVDPIILLMVDPGGAASVAVPSPTTWNAALPMRLNFARPLSVSTVAAVV